VAVAIGGVVVLRAAGIAPELFAASKAWAEEAAPTPAKPAQAVCALTPDQLARQAGISPAELRVIQSLSQRRTELDARDADLASMLPLLAAAEQKLDAKTQALNAVKAEVQALLGQVGEREKAEVDRLVAVYSAMRPKDAARVFGSLDDSVRLPVAAAMRPRSLAAIMAQMDPNAARVLTEKLARRFDAQQQLAARAAAAAAATTPATPAATNAAEASANAPATATPPAAAEARPAPATPRPAARQPSRANRPTARPAAQPAVPRSRPQAAPSEPTGERPYQAAGAAAAPPAANPAAPRQSVQ